jgi:hypothetical protein
LVLRLADTQQQLPAASTASTLHKQPAASESSASSFRESFIYSKQEVEQQFWESITL